MPPRFRIMLLRLGALAVCLCSSAAFAGQASWRAGEMIISESAPDVTGWLTLSCQGVGCPALIEAASAGLPAAEQRRVNGQVQLLADHW